MNCSDAEGLIAAQLDGELDAARARVLDDHLDTCPACRAERDSMRDLKQRIAGAAPYHRAPASLRQEIGRQLDGERPGVAADARSLASARRRSFSFGLAAGAAAASIGLVGIGAWIEHGTDGDTAHELVDAHVRASLADHRIDVASSDQHTVKPWLSARLDYSPPVLVSPLPEVRLVGARVESIDRQRIATLVYRYRAHWIDVYVRPSSSSPLPVVTSQRSIRGFNVVPASGSGMDWRVVSDAGTDVLLPLAQRLAAAGETRETR